MTLPLYDLRSSKLRGVTEEWLQEREWEVRRVRLETMAEELRKICSDPSRYDRLVRNVGEGPLKRFL